MMNTSYRSIQAPFHRARVCGLSVALLFLAVIWAHSAEVQHRMEQSDWSSGPNAGEATTSWHASFLESEGVSWLAIPGQLSLSSVPLGTASSHALDPNAPRAIKVVADDIDSDGDSDVLVASFEDSTITLWHNLGGQPPQWMPEVIATESVYPTGLSTADVDGDGRNDILATATDLGEVVWLRNLGGSPPTWARFLISSTVAGGHDAVGGDLDSDGDTDVVVPAFEDDQLLWFRNQGGEPIQWEKIVIEANWDYPCKVSLVDVDSDGDLDVVATAWLAEEVAWWRNDGGTPLAWTRFSITTGFTGTHWVDCADIDGDGAVDVLAAAMNRSEVVWWRNLGGNPVRWRRFTITSNLIGAVSLQPADMDGDNDLDVVACGWHPRGGVAWYENSSSGQTWLPHTVDRSFGEGSSVFTADIDGDGDLDLLSSSWSRGEVKWWELSEFVSSGTLTSSVLDTGGVTEWGEWQAMAEIPAGTEIIFEVRTSDDPDNLGPWALLDNPDLSSVLPAGLRYFQYRVQLRGGAIAGSPLLQSVALSWTSTGSAPPRRPRGRTKP